jgi:hypothetical protein
MKLLKPMFIVILQFGFSSQCLLAEEPDKVRTEGRILALETGWGADTISVRLDSAPVKANEIVEVPLPCPAGPGNCGTIPLKQDCSTQDAGYALDPQDLGVKVHEAALLGAYLSGQKVRLLLQGCSFHKPKIIAVGLGDPL